MMLTHTTPPVLPIKTKLSIGSWLLIASMCLNAAPASNSRDQTLTWVFLTAGEGRAKARSISKEALSAMQAQHVGNFGTQFNRGTLMAAGPLGDNGLIRGIVLLPITQPEQIAECFKPDPFIQNNILEAETHPWRVDVMKFGTPKIPFQLAQHTLCILKKGTNWNTPQDWASTSDSVFGLLPGLEADFRSGALAVAGPFLDAGDKLGVLLFYATNEAPIRARLEGEPAVANGRVAFELHRQFLGKGTLHDPNDPGTPPKPGKRVRLFDGKNFAGWEGNTQQVWRIEDDALVGGSLTQTVPHNDFLCTTREFGNFDLRLKVKLTGTGFVNGGVQLRSQRLKDPLFEMTGYQADMGVGYWGSLYDESRRNKTLAHTHVPVIQRILKPDDWNEYVIRCEDKHIRLWLNGVLTVDYAEDDTSIPQKGFIGLQIHGGGKALAYYKDITVAELP
jgi:hypothetical protein